MNRLKQALQKFMQGRYGADHLGRDMMWVSVFILIVSLVTRSNIVRYVAMALLVILYYRMFSKKYTKRYNENRIYLNWRNKAVRKLKKGFQRIKDFPKYKYLRCPQCQRQMRVPRGKKAIVVKCPQCNHKFEART